MTPQFALLTGEITNVFGDLFAQEELLAATKTPAKKTPAKKAPAKKAPAKKAPAQKAPAKNAPARKTLVVTCKPEPGVCPFKKTKAPTCKPEPGVCPPPAAVKKTLQTADVSISGWILPVAPQPQPSPGH